MEDGGFMSPVDTLIRMNDYDSISKHAQQFERRLLAWSDPVDSSSFNTWNTLKCVEFFLSEGGILSADDMLGVYGLVADRLINKFDFKFSLFSIGNYQSIPLLRHKKVDALFFCFDQIYNALTRRQEGGVESVVVQIFSELYSASNEALGYHPLLDFFEFGMQWDGMTDHELEYLNSAMTNSNDDAIVRSLGYAGFDTSAVRFWMSKKRP